MSTGRARHKHAQAFADGGCDYELHASTVELRNDAAHRPYGLPTRRQSKRPGDRVFGPPLLWHWLRHGLRPVDGPYPRPRRRVGHGRTTSPDPALFAALRHGPAVG